MIAILSWHRSPLYRAALPLLIAFPALATAAAPLDPERVHSPEKLLKDFAIFRKALEGSHPSIYRYTSKAVLDVHFDRTERSITRA